MQLKEVGGAVRMSRVGAVLALVVSLLLGAGFGRPTESPQPPAATPAAVPGLVPTAHPAIPATWAETWLVPEPGSRPQDAWRVFAQGVRSYQAGRHATAMASFDDGRLATTPLAGYARYYAGLCARQLQQPTVAKARLDAALAAADASDTALAALTRFALAELAEASGDSAAAVSHYEVLATRLRPAAPDQALAGLVRSALAMGDRGRAESAALRLYYEFPTSAQGETAAQLVADLRARAGGATAAEFFKRDLGRGERLFAARLWDDARLTFEGLRPSATADDLELIDLRIAECDQHTGRSRAAADRLAPYLERASRRAEARYYDLLAQRDLGHAEEFVRRAWALADEFRDSSWSAEALNHLATYHILRDEDDLALSAFARVLEQHPSSRPAERAAWKVGWSQYRAEQFAAAAETFERAAVNAPRSDYRPSWLYWSGRARERTGDRAGATARYQVAIADYRNSYYGRLATEALSALGQPASPPSPAAAAPAPAPVMPAGNAPAQAAAAQAPRPPNAGLIKALLGLELYDLAEAEVTHAQRTWGPSPMTDATLAWIFNREGELRKGISAMRRAYPQFLTAGGDRLPLELLQVIYPLDYWPLIRRHSERRGIDPYLAAALIAQESTFQADARSAANAWGLMQIVPATGRRLARADGLRRFRPSQLTDPEVNVRLGMRYLAGLIGDFGGAHFALASYNAGESRVVRWQGERPGWSREEFIDDIPFPETQNYVKRILGTAEDYRRLYGERGALPVPIATRATAAAAPARDTRVSAGSTAKTSSKPTRAKAAKPKATGKAKPKPRTTSKPRKRGT